jgi:hypothetical protein
MRVALVLLQAGLAAATVLGPLQGLVGRVCDAVQCCSAHPAAPPLPRCRG